MKCPICDAETTNHGDCDKCNSVVEDALDDYTIADGTIPLAGIVMPLESPPVQGEDDE